VLDHLAAAGPSTADDLKTELGLKPRELKAVLDPLELRGTVLMRPIEPTEDGQVEGYEYVRWDDIVPRTTADGAGIDDVVVAGVSAAVLASERELSRWFAWPNLIDAELVERLVRSGRLVRPAPEWVTTPAFS
jgi:hypothetical protein